MRSKRGLYLGVAALALLLAAAPVGLKAQTTVAIDNDDIDYVYLCQLYNYFDVDIHIQDFFEHYVEKNPYNHHMLLLRNVCLI